MESIKFISNEIDIFQKEELYDDVIEKTSFVVHPMGNVNDEGSVISFHLNSTPGYYLDLSETYMELTLNVEQQTPNSTDDNKSYDIHSPINNIVQSLWSNIDVYFNNTLVSSTNQCYHFKAYLMSLLKFFGEYELLGSGQGFNNDFTFSQRETFENIRYKNILEKRSAGFKHKIQFRCPILMEIFQTKKFLPENVNVQVCFKRNFNKFCIQQDVSDTNVYGIKISNMTLGGQKVKIAPLLYSTINDIYQQNNIHLFHENVVCKKFQLPKEITNFNFNNIFSGDCPNIALITFLKTDNFEGNDKQSDRYIFENMSLTNITCKLNNQSIPVGGYRNLDFDENLKVSHPFYELIKTLWIKKSINPGITLEDWATNGNTVFLFNFSPLRSKENRIIEKGVIDLEASFKEPTNVLHTVLVFGFFNQDIEISKNGDISINIL